MPAQGDCSYIRPRGPKVKIVQKGDSYMSNGFDGNGNVNGDKLKRCVTISFT